MQTASELARPPGAMPEPSPDAPPSCSSPVSEVKVIRRNGAVVASDPLRISIAMTKVLLAVSGAEGTACARNRDLAAQPTRSVSAALARCQPDRATAHIADIPQSVHRVGPVGQVRGGERAPGARPQAARAVGRGDGCRSEVFRRFAGVPRSCSARAARPLTDAFRDRSETTGGGGSPAARMDRPGAVAQHMAGAAGVRFCVLDDPACGASP